MLTPEWTGQRMLSVAVGPQIDSLTSKGDLCGGVSKHRRGALKACLHTPKGRIAVRPGHVSSCRTVTSALAVIKLRMRCRFDSRYLIPRLRNMSILSRSTMLLRRRLQPASSWCGAMPASDSPAMRRWMSDKKVEHEGEDMPNFDVRVRHAFLDCQAIKLSA